MIITVGPSVWFKFLFIILRNWNKIVGQATEIELIAIHLRLKI